MSHVVKNSLGQMARVHGHPGEGARSAGWLHILWPLLVAGLVGGYLIRAALPKPEISSFLAGTLLLVLAVSTMALILRSEKALKHYLKGAEGEERIARLLSLLSAEFAIFHGVPLGGQRGGAGDIDHIAVGPTGVFVIETKNWSQRVKLEGGELLVGGEVPDRHPVVQIQQAATALEEFFTRKGLTGVSVQPVLCFVSNVFSGGAIGSRGVTICNEDRLMSVLSDSGMDLLSKEFIQQVEEILVSVQQH